MDKFNITEQDGMRAYEYKGHRALLPVDWTDEQRAEWFETALQKVQLRRPLKLIKKNGYQQLISAWRLNNGER